MKFLLDKGGDPNKGYDSYLPLASATRHNSEGILKLLLSRGARLYQRDEDGETALHEAFGFKNWVAADFLIAAGLRFRNRVCKS